MTQAPVRRRSLRRNESGVALSEFALIAVPLCLILMGGLDMGYQLYVRAVMQGAVQNASRLTTVLTDSTLANDTTIETAMKTQIQRIAPQGTVVNVTKESFYQFSNINTLEPLTVDINSNGVLNGPVDTDGNGSLDSTDCFRDVNANGVRDVATTGRTGIGAADDIVKYTATVTYSRISPIFKFVRGMPQTVTMTASSMARRQPYKGQVPPPEVCAT